MISPHGATVQSSADGNSRLCLKWAFEMDNSMREMKGIGHRDRNNPLGKTMSLSSDLLLGGQLMNGMGRQGPH